MSTSSITALAGEMFSAFEQGKRDDGSEFFKLRDGSPDWMTDVVHDAHGNMLPDDWRYEFVRAAVANISDAETDDVDSLRDSLHEMVDGSVDVYTARLTAWLASHLDRVGYCDEAREEFGMDTTDDVGMSRLLALGQYQERYWVFASVLDSLEQVAG